MYSTSSTSFLLLFCLAQLFHASTASHIYADAVESVYQDLFSLPAYRIATSNEIVEEAQVERNSSSVIMTSTNADSYLCLIPGDVSGHQPDLSVSSSSHSLHHTLNDVASAPSDGLDTIAPTQMQPQAGISSGISLLKPMQSHCIYMVQGWWTYEFCHMKHLRQFHQFLPGEVHATKEDFVLGDFKVPLEKQKIVLDRGSDNGTHLSYKFGGGSFCRAIEGGRFVHLRFFCDPRTMPDRLVEVKELATCFYSATIHTSRLCSHVDFSNTTLDTVSKRPIQAIQCRLLLASEHKQSHSNKLPIILNVPLPHPSILEEPPKTANAENPFSQLPRIVKSNEELKELAIQLAESWSQQNNKNADNAKSTHSPPEHIDKNSIMKIIMVNGQPTIARAEVKSKSQSTNNDLLEFIRIIEEGEEDQDAKRDKEKSSKDPTRNVHGDA